MISPFCPLVQSAMIFKSVSIFIDQQQISDNIGQNVIIIFLFRGLSELITFSALQEYLI